MHRRTATIDKSIAGYSLLELVSTLAVLAILVMGTIPMAQNGVKRQKELRLRESLRMMRNAIDEFKRDSMGACPQGAVTSGNPTIAAQGGNIPTDPRSRVVIDDCKIFETDNPDRYPPTIETLVDGVKVKARGANVTAGSGISGDSKQATELNEIKELNKVYLRELPVDPMTGKADWKFRSSYQDKDSDNWDEVNVFDVRSSSDDEAMNGEKYSEW
ncbi:MAG TPA: type II secretion system protein [Pyrinomonadaceae bacterium]|nr:type II secretion system protein [Chloracidobacterium sp.]MBP9934449.1 type II secretion system protein [Pyrinomonadaceae bacterium]MBK7802568.1 type II secretion system protein [Chloracidobacterium sp.]MBK9437423.1 type II secretion system protein [Chloracidobacterium sp.]MBL0240093.1 type II secretion system protein [Chloracidobacterium sp.]